MKSRMPSPYLLEHPKIEGTRMDASETDKIALTEAERAGLTWQKARLSTWNGQCIEIARIPDKITGKIAMRDSKDPNGPILVYTEAEFKAFLDGARNGEFDKLVQ